MHDLADFIADHLALVIVALLGVAVCLSVLTQTDSINESDRQGQPFELVGKEDGREIYKVKDGDTSCYMADFGNITGVALSCLKEEP